MPGSRGLRRRTTDQRRQLHREQAGRCWYCTRTISFHLATVDHIQPLSKGGTNKMQNLVMACPDCNKTKGSTEPDHHKTAARLQWLRSQPIVEWTPGSHKRSDAR